MRITSQNVKARPVMPRPHIDQVISQALAGSGIVGWQEIYRHEYVDALVRAGGKRFRHYFPDKGGVPVSWRHKRFRLIHAETRVLHQGEAGICLPRRIAVVELEDRRTGLRFAVLNLHQVPSAWSGSKGEVATRRQLWRTGQANAQATVSEFVALGLPVVVLGDFNSRNAREPALGRTVAGRGVRYHVPSRSIDQVITVDGADRRWDVTAEDALPKRFGDHAGRRITARLTARPRTQGPAMPKKTITQRVVANARKRGVVVIDRGDWDSAHADVYAYRRKHKPARQPADTVVQHITVTLDHGPLTGDFKADVRTIERIGMERFGSGVSYNWVVDMETGMVAVGQPLDAKGTHTVNDKDVVGFSHDQNLVARAIAVLGMPNDKLSPAAADAITQLLAAMVDEGAITEGFDYVPHSLFAFKDCPCDSTRDQMKTIRTAVTKEIR